MNPISPWVKILAVLLLLAALLGEFYFYGNQQFGLGEKAERALWLKRDNTDLSNANAKIKSLEEQYRQREHDHANVLAAVSSQYQKDLKHVKDDKDRTIASLHDGSMRLRISLATAIQACRGAASEVVAATAGRDGDTRAELSIEASEFLISFASEADEVTKQLGRCQDIINADRQLGGSNGR